MTKPASKVSSMQKIPESSGFWHSFGPLCSASDGRAERLGYQQIFLDKSDTRAVVSVSDQDHGGDNGDENGHGCDLLDLAETRVARDETVLGDVR